MTMIKWQPRTQAPVSEFDRLFGNFFGQSCEGETCSWAPRVDITETEQGYGVTVELPGVEKSDISISVEDGHLIIGGERKSAELEEGRKFRRQERFLGKFQRRFALPEEIEVDAIAAELKNGLLEVSIPKGEKVRGRSIEVK